MKNHLLLYAALLVNSTGAIAQTTAYPEGAEALSPEALTAALSEKSFTISPAGGPTWRWQFNANGYYYLHVGSYSDSGKWTSKERSLCLQSPKNTGCNEMRQKDGTLYFKRDSGEVVSFQPR